MDKVIEQTRMFFEWRDRASLGFDRKKFVGYSSKAEITNGEIDQREMFDWATETPEMTVQAQPWEQLRGASIGRLSPHFQDSGTLWKHLRRFRIKSLSKFSVF